MKAVHKIIILLAVTLCIFALGAFLLVRELFPPRVFETSHILMVRTSSAVSAESETLDLCDVWVDGTKISADEPFIYSDEGHFLVSAEYFRELFNMKVSVYSYIRQLQLATHDKSITITLKFDETSARKNTTPFELDEHPFESGDKLYLCLGSIAKALGYIVLYDIEEESIIIHSQDYEAGFDDKESAVRNTLSSLNGFYVFHTQSLLYFNGYSPDKYEGERKFTYTDMYVPFKEAARLLNADIEWKAAENSLYIRDFSGIEIKMMKYLKAVNVNGKETEVKSDLQIVENQPYVPLLEVAKILGFTVGTDEESQAVAIMTPGFAENFNSGEAAESHVFALLKNYFDGGGQEYYEEILENESIGEVQNAAETGIEILEYGRYGKSGKGRDLEFYTITNEGKYEKTILLTFAMHGYEGAYDMDGGTLRDAAYEVIRHYYINPHELKNTRMIVVPLVNPDGLYEGYTNHGFGRTQISLGVDINRDFPRGHSVISDSTYYTQYPLSAPESKALADLTEEVHPDIVIDFHGWLNQALGNSDLVKIFAEELGLRTRTSFSARHGGFYVYWAESLGAQTLLVENPSSLKIDVESIIRALKRTVDLITTAY